MNPLDTIQTAVRTIPPLRSRLMDEASTRQGQLTKPAGALGRLEALSIQLAGITGRLDPRFTHKRVIVCAGDHGVASEGVSAYLAEVTSQMVLNFLAGGAAINVLARRVGADVTVVDLGVAAALPAHPNLVAAKIAFGTQNMAQGPAMARDQALQAIATGINVVNDLANRGKLDLVVLGEMGIANTTPAAAIGAAITGQPPAEITGRGTGVDDAGLARKIAVIERALAVNRPDPTDAIDVLAKVGGFEIGGLAGICLGAAARRIPVLVDGFITTSAALIAVTLAPAVKPYLVSAHRSQERGHRVILHSLGLLPLLDLDLRLGEGTGGALAIPLVEAAVAILNEMATFDSAGVSQKAEN
ncbi:MAG TPA: nicotinate-nucleotide--dimethylbenzimidazole phosphoribosyltransferase [Chloroflexi bacterium]|nr:nicotinate-nucleotide--dimethylbenzimidazole phosphoribosyltransferase [Chloroflexota bacterium]